MDLSFSFCTCCDDNHIVGEIKGNFNAKRSETEHYGFLRKKFGEIESMPRRSPKRHFVQKNMELLFFRQLFLLLMQFCLSNIQSISRNNTVTQIYTLSLSHSHTRTHREKERERERKREKEREREREREGEREEGERERDKHTLSKTRKLG